MARSYSTRAQVDQARQFLEQQPCNFFARPAESSKKRYYEQGSETGTVFANVTKQLITCRPLRIDPAAYPLWRPGEPIMYHGLYTHARYVCSLAAVAALGTACAVSNQQAEAQKDTKDQPKAEVKKKELFKNVYLETEGEKRRVLFSAVVCQH